MSLPQPRVLLASASAYGARRRNSGFSLPGSGGFVEAVPGDRGGEDADDVAVHPPPRVFLQELYWPGPSPGRQLVGHADSHDAPTARVRGVDVVDLEGHYRVVE